MPAGLEEFPDLQILGKPFDAFATARQAVKPRVDQEVLADREPVRQIDKRRGEIHPRQHPIAVPQHVLAENLHPACGRQQEAEQDREGRRLAGTIAAEQCCGDTTPDSKADAVYRDGARIVLDEIFDFDRKFDHRPNMAHDRSSGHQRLAPLHRRGAFFGTRCSECVKQSDIG